jgi:raffinose/stachyose/melibiose transport system permease protein
MAIVSAPMTARGRAASQATLSPVASKKKDSVYYALLLPSLILFTLCITIPAIVGIVYSFTDSVGFGAFTFVGIQNYIAAFQDPSIWQAYGFTFLFAIVTTIVVNVIAFLLAMGLNAKIGAKTALRTIFVIPMVISGIVIAYVFSYLFSNTLPGFATALHLGALETSMLANPSTAWIAIVIVAAWQGIPGTLLIYTAGLLSIPGEVYEAGSIDGATGWRKLISITIPLTAGYIVINVIMGFKGFMNVYDVVIGLTNGGPGTATTSVAMVIFGGLGDGQYAYQMANATIFFLITIIVALLQLRLNRRGAAF